MKPLGQFGTIGQSELVHGQHGGVRAVRSPCKTAWPNQQNFRFLMAQFRCAATSKRSAGLML